MASNSKLKHTNVAERQTLRNKYLLNSISETFVNLSKIYTILLLICNFSGIRMKRK